MRLGKFGEMKNFWVNKKILVTGHTGFKGGWLTLWLSSLGAKVVGYALPPETSQSFYEAAKIQECAESIIGDIRDFENFKRVLVSANPDIVFHMAAQPLVRRSYDQPRETFDTNVMGTVNIMEALRVAKTSCRVLINVTTDKCYQNNHWVWGYRENDALGGSDPYSYSKSCAEFVANAYRKSFFETGNIRLASLRAGNVIGGGDWSEDRLIPDIIRSIFTHQPLTVRNPDSVRPWQHVLEPLFGYLKAAEQLYLCEHNHVQDYASLNFGPTLDGSMCVEWIVNKLIEKDSRGLTYEISSHQSDSKMEEKVLMLDSAKARNLLNWGSMFELSEALKWTYDWYKASYDGKAMREYTLHQIRKYEQLVK
jgi:CDP-glucose 4,6-dehydratase